MKYIDLTHLVSDGLPEWPGCGSVSLQETVTMQKDGVANHQLNGSCHMGTHIDAPGHFIMDGKKISDYPVDQFIGRGVVIDARGQTEIGVELVQDQVKANDIVLFYTGWSERFYESNYFYDYPVISLACAQYLVNQKVKMVGIDTPSVDRAPFEVHKLLLGNEILIIENLMNVQAILGYNQVEIVALPLKLDAHGAPARVVALISEY
jgi:kynurenine formamidase